MLHWKIWRLKLSPKSVFWIFTQTVSSPCYFIDISMKIWVYCIETFTFLIVSVLNQPFASEDGEICFNTACTLRVKSHSWWGEKSQLAFSNIHFFLIICTYVRTKLIWATFNSKYLFFCLFTVMGNYQNVTEGNFPLRYSSISKSWSPKRGVKEKEGYEINNPYTHTR